jgi:bacterioferritin-associated ferredoxin
MIVCVCNVLCEQRCREAAGHPESRSVGCIYRRLGCRVRCGKCVPFMQDLFAAARQAEAAPLPEATSPPAG